MTIFLAVICLFLIFALVYSIIYHIKNNNYSEKHINNELSSTLDFYKAIGFIYDFDYNNRYIQFMDEKDNKISILESIYKENNTTYYNLISFVPKKTSYKCDEDKLFLEYIKSYDIVDIRQNQDLLRTETLEKYKYNINIMVCELKEKSVNKKDIDNKITIVEEPKINKKTNEKEYKNFIKQSKTRLTKIKNLSYEINDEDIYINVADLDEMCQEIFNFINENPDKLEENIDLLKLHLPNIQNKMKEFNSLNISGNLTEKVELNLENEIEKSLNECKLLWEKVIM